MNGEDPDTQELRLAQSVRQAEEKKLAVTAAEEEEAAKHARRAEKAEYLREKLEERAESERAVAEEQREAGGDE